jgi:hypothetical protein
MELKKFVEETLLQVMEGVKSAQEKASNYGGRINPSSGMCENIHFDVAITTVEGKNKKEGIGIFVGSLGLGSQGEKENLNSSVSRIKFQVLVDFPRQ